MDYFAAVLLITAIYFVGKGKWWAWAINIVATLLWSYIGILNGLWGMVGMNMILTIINVKNLIVWFKNDKYEQS